METKWHHLCWGLSYILHHSQQALIKVGFKHFAHLPNPHLKPPVLSLLVPGSVEKPITEPHNGVLDQTVGLGTKITKRWQSSREREKKKSHVLSNMYKCQLFNYSCLLQSLLCVSIYNLLRDTISVVMAIYVKTFLVVITQWGKIFVCSSHDNVVSILPID